MAVYAATLPAATCVAFLFRVKAAGASFKQNRGGGCDRYAKFHSAHLPWMRLIQRSAIAGDCALKITSLMQCNSIQSDSIATSKRFDEQRRQVPEIKSASSDQPRTSSRN
jgi:hypothetical protein